MLLNGSNRNGNVVEYKQDPIIKSKYHDEIEHGDDDVSHDEPEVRYWSDFNRLFYTSKTVQRLPDIADWENVEGHWQEGREMFRRFDEVRWISLSCLIDRLTNCPLHE